MVSYTDPCDVQYVATIYIENSNSYNALRSDGQIISLEEPIWPNVTWDESAFQYDDAQLNSYWDLFHN